MKNNIDLIRREAIKEYLALEDDVQYTRRLVDRPGKRLSAAERELREKHYSFALGELSRFMNKLGMDHQGTDLSQSSYPAGWAAR